VEVGWAARAQTFFASVIDTTIPNDHAHEPCVLWVGTSEGELPTLEALADALAPYAAVPDATQAQLLADQAVPYEHSPLEKHMLRILRQIRRMA